jgi:hypothetical protein
VYLRNATKNKKGAELVLCALVLLMFEWGLAAYAGRRHAQTCPMARKIEIIIAKPAPDLAAGAECVLVAEKGCMI